MKRAFFIFLLIGSVALCPRVSWADQPVRIASKHFTESYILAEVMAQLLEAKGIAVRRSHGLGGTMICFRALHHGQIDLYPEYTGTIEQEILKSQTHLSETELQEQLRRKYGVEPLASFGFNNSYAVAMTQKRAKALRISTISDLKRHPSLKGGVSYEFLKRKDGWGALSQHYDLSISPVGLEHGLAYEALVKGKIDFTDAYTTDAKIEKFNLVMLEDDRHFFPTYLAVPLARKGLPQEVRSILSPLKDLIGETTMIRLNARAELGKVPFREIARQFLIEEGLILEKEETEWEHLLTNLGRRTLEHLFLTGIALLAAISIAIPLGVLVYRFPRSFPWVIPLTGVLQTIPSIALLAFMIPLFGIGKLPAIVALFVYGLLPIVRNTYTGLKNVDPAYLEISEAMGLTMRQRFRLVEFPLSFPIILAGVRTAAVINIGTATLAAFIGAGGLGEPIVTGLALNDTRMILEGAIPAALLAILTEQFFRLFDRQKWREEGR